MQLKHMTRVLDKRSRLEVLGMVAVKDGLAMATDLEVSVSMPCHLADGLYYAKAWARDQYVPNSQDNLEDFPIIPSLSGEKILTIESLDIANVIEASADKWGLNGFLVEYNEQGQYLLVATDGHRLHCSGEEKLLQGEKQNQVIVMRKTWDLLQLHHTWEMWLGKEDVFFKNGQTTITSRIISEKFPNYRAVFPDLNDHLVIGNEDLLDCMSALHIQCNRIGSQTRNNGIILYHRENDTLGVYRHDSDKDKTFRMESGIECYCDVNAAFNGQYISDIDSIEGTKKVFYKDAESPIVIRHNRGSCIAMPLNL